MIFHACYNFTPHYSATVNNENCDPYLYAAKGEQGYLLFGQYLRIPTGTYRVIFY
jgi:hypothetical protein